MTRIFILVSTIVLSDCSNSIEAMRTVQQKVTEQSVIEAMRAVQQKVTYQRVV